MCKILAAAGLAAAAGVSPRGAVAEAGLRECAPNGVALFGDVEVVDSFPDFKVQIVKSFPDLRVKLVDRFPDSCGEWRMVDSFPDFKIQYVDSFPDLKIEAVDSFPGVP